MNHDRAEGGGWTHKHRAGGGPINSERDLLDKDIFFMANTPLRPASRPGSAFNLTNHITSDLDDAEALPHHANNRARDDVVNLHACMARLSLEIAWNRWSFLIQG